MVPSPCRNLAAQPPHCVPQSPLPPPGIPQPSEGGKFILKVCTWASGAVTCLHEPSLDIRLGRLGRPLLVCIGQCAEHVCACADQELSCYLSSVGHKPQQTPTTEGGNASGLGFLPGRVGREGMPRPYRLTKVPGSCHHLRVVAPMEYHFQGAQSLNAP